MNKVIIKIKDYFIVYLIKLGFTWNALILLFIFFSSFIFLSVLYLMFYNYLVVLTWILVCLPIIFFDIFLGTIIFNSSLKIKFKQIEEENKRVIYKEPRNIYKKLKIFMACFGTFGGICILLIFAIVILGLEQYLEIFFILYSSFGLILIFFIFWPFYSKYLK